MSVTEKKARLSAVIGYNALRIFYYVHDRQANSIFIGFKKLEFTVTARHSGFWLDEARSSRKKGAGYSRFV